MHTIIRYGKNKPGILLVMLGVVCLFILRSIGSSAATPSYANSNFGISGRVIDLQGEPVQGAAIELIINGESEANDDEHNNDNPSSQTDGNFFIEIPADDLDEITSISLTISRRHFHTTGLTASSDQLSQLKSQQSIRLPDIEMERRITAGFWVASIVFVLILILIALEKLHNTMAALLGTAIILGVSYVGGAFNEMLYIFDFQQALEYVNFDVIFLVMGMMIVIAVIEETGIFQWLAFQSYRLSGGRVWLLITILMTITAVASALLDNVTTMLLMTPISIQIALALGLDPLALIIPEILASNVGGISTLIGTPTNILIGSYANLSFNDFVRYLTPGVLIAQVALIGYVLIRYRKQFFKGRGVSPALMEMLQESGRITQPEKLKKAGIVFGITIVFFVIGESIHLIPAVTALIGAVAMLLWVSPDVEEMLSVVDWTTLMFFIALFIVVGAIQEVGLISMIAAALGKVVGTSLTTSILVLIWAAALLSGVIANIPFTAAMLPVVGFLTRTVPGATSNVLFYGLSIGSAMGGNSTLIGASANLVAAGISERAGYKITYVEFLKAGFPATIITVLVGTIWLFIRF
ncbi:MAG: ArsB/NhaD family transporter [Anaerolineales bacterium]|nr:ArsB/NhaD family transporter [Anaerolineales bacterium]